MMKFTSLFAVCHSPLGEWLPSHIPTGFFLVLFYIQLYGNNKFRVGKFEHFFKVGGVTGNRGIFFGL